jgi:hypothetical protein
MKSLVNLLFDEWLTLMEKAYEVLSKEGFRLLEDKIKGEIAYSRRHKKKFK